MKIFALISIVWMCALSSPALAQETEQVLSDFDTAVEAYSGGNYSKAAALFQKAYAQNPDPLLLYNAAKAQAKASSQNLEGLKTAQALLARALAQEEKALGPKDRLRAEQFETELTAQMADLQAELEQKKQFEQQQRQAELEQKKQFEQQQRQAELRQYQQDEAAGFGPWGWTGVGLGVLGTGALIASALLASDVSGEQERLRIQSGQSPEQFEADRAQSQSDQQTAQILLFSGLGALGTAAGLVTWELLRGKEGNERTILSMKPSGVNLEVKW